MSQNTLYYGGLASGNQYINLCRDLSWMNSKNHEHSDRDGHVLGYICNIKIMGSRANFLQFAIAPNSWKMRNSFRKWHAYRDLMFSEAGVTDSEKGRYGKTIRPYLDAGMSSGTIKDPLGWDISGTPPTQTQEWSYTQIASNPGFSADATGSDGMSLVDLYDLNICGVNQEDTPSPQGSLTYTAVGMIHSYNQDRQEIVTPTLDSETIEGQNNPLALLKQGGSVAGGEVMDLAEDQELEAPPYDITDGGFSTSVVLADIMQINPGWNGTDSIPNMRTTQIFVPAGLLKINATSGDTGASVLIDVVGTVLCKDMA
jgi:hypothetical protein